MNISTDMLSAFVKVAERLSVSAAAQELGVGKGVVSKRLAQLEDSIKTTLVTRNSRKLALTPCGLV
jgi:DNA-binding transcriptional LysR family regulator